MAVVHQDALAVLEDDLAGITVTNRVKDDSMCHILLSDWSQKCIVMTQRTSDSTNPSMPSTTNLHGRLTTALQVSASRTSRLTSRNQCPEMLMRENALSGNRLQ